MFPIIDWMRMVLAKAITNRNQTLVQKPRSRVLAGSVCHRWISCSACIRTPRRSVAISELKLAPEVAIVGAALTYRQTTPLTENTGTDSFACQHSRKAADLGILDQWQNRLSTRG